MTWQPMQKATPIRNPKALQALRDQYTASYGPVPDDAWEQLCKDAESSEHYKNDLYHAVVRRNLDNGLTDRKTWHLSIKRNNRAPVMDWRHKQQIKNEVIGPDYEGVELYPVEERLVDTANQYHIWGFEDAGIQIPFGFTERVVMDSEDHPDATHKQRKF